MDEDKSPEQVEEWGKEFEARAKHCERIVERLTNTTAAIDNDREKENEMKRNQFTAKIDLLKNAGGGAFDYLTNCCCKKVTENTVASSPAAWLTF